MPFAFLLALAAIAGATVLTYLYDREANIWARLCAGVCLGFAALGLVGFVSASASGMGPAALALAGAVCASPLLLLLRGGRRALLLKDLREGLSVSAGAVVFYAAAALLFWLVYSRAMYQTSEGIFTGVDTNLGDMPFHLAVITGFVHGENFPPQHPEFAGVRLTYPFVVDFVSAMFVRAGASLEGALFWPNFAMIMALVGLLHRWALKQTRERTAALIVPALVLLSGGFGWLVFLREAASSGQGVFAMLGALPHDYTRAYPGFEWGNAVTALFVTQRSILLGVAVALVVWTLWWQASEGPAGSVEEGAAEVEGRRAGKRKAKGKGRQVAPPKGAVEDEEAAADGSYAFLLAPFALRQMLAAGVVAGLLPLVHAHSFAVMMLMGACMAVAQGAAVLFSKSEEARTEAPAWKRVWAVWRPWLLFAVVASVLALPQMFYATRDSAVRAEEFFGWEFGWAHGQTNVVWFWIKNTAVFIPLLVVALVWRGAGVSRRLLFFYLPFLLCFVVPNVYRLAPWVWDNIKILLYWWIASAPLLALVLVRLWRRGGAWRVAAVGLLLMQTAAGGLDVWRAASGAVERRSFERDGVAFAEVVKQQTDPRSLILHAPTYNDPVYLTGRRTFLGYPGHVWSHGIDYARREAALVRIYTGSADAPALIERAGIEYVVVGPLEREEMNQRHLTLNDSFFARYRKVGEAGAYRLYKTKP